MVYEVREAAPIIRPFQKRQRNIVKKEAAKRATPIISMIYEERETAPIIRQVKKKMRHHQESDRKKHDEESRYTLFITIDNKL